jgi:hypothetical protein
LFLGRLKSFGSPTVPIATLVMSWVEELLFLTVTEMGLSATKTPSAGNTRVVGLPGGGGVNEIGGGAAPSVTTTFVAVAVPDAFCSSNPKV